MCKNFLRFGCVAQLMEYWMSILCVSVSSLLPGVNVPDHDMTFQSLTELLQLSVTPYVVSLQAKECGGWYVQYKDQLIKINYSCIVNK